MKELYLTEDSLLQCSFGSCPSQLKVTSQRFLRIREKLQATEGDNKPNENIFPFGVCSLTQKPCAPAPINWEKTPNWGKINYMSGISSKSELPCAKGGIITSKEAGQGFVAIAQSEPEKHKPIVLSRQDIKEESTEGYIIVATSDRFGGNIFYKYSDGKLYAQADDTGRYETRFKLTTYTGQLDNRAQKIYEDLELLRTNSEGKKLLDFFDKEKHEVTIMIPQETMTVKNDVNHTDENQIKYQGKPVDLPEEGRFSLVEAPSYIVLGHEMGHAKSNVLKISDHSEWYSTGKSVMIDEIYATHIENKIRMAAGMKLRNQYDLSDLSFVMDNNRNSYYINKNESNYPMNPPLRLAPKDAFNYNSIKNDI